MKQDENISKERGMYQDCELGEELYEALREFNQEQEDKWRTAEGKQLSLN